MSITIYPSDEILARIDAIVDARRAVPPGPKVAPLTDAEKAEMMRIARAVSVDAANAYARERAKPASRVARSRSAVALELMEFGLVAHEAGKLPPLKIAEKKLKPATFEDEMRALGFPPPEPKPKRRVKKKRANR